ncbi:PfkB family carbohydrate kinase [Actinoplanes sp. NBRC 103695]|uniref:carbohydrate kinase family protein n=1 Tax=Actinoplanes sp. NBRC 103695 TaxID=3032202 RepID=UPI0024A0CB14|nr:PfkB family carbohydrate kinase [Actinoplanes sp. NBRC 103695]GLY95290.1 sugar kinase [Actinoplanes sp. NBRC 103695]
MLLIVGEAIVVYQRQGDGPWTGPWPSGAPAISSYVASQLGVEVAFVGGVGRDDHAKVMTDGLGAAAHLIVSDDLPTATAYITYHGEDRSFDFRVTGSAAAAVPSAALGDLPERARWVHLSGSALVFGEPLATTALEAVRRGKAAGATISVDPNVRVEALTEAGRSALIAVLREADVLLPSEGELEALGVDPAGLDAVVCTTYGAAGAEVNGVRVEAPPVNAIDTDGAGDTFAAGYIAAALDGADPVSAARNGIRAAGAAVTVEGPMTVVFD